MISRPFFSSIAFRLPVAITLICALAFGLSAIAIYGLQKAREEMAAYGLQAYSSLAQASLVSRQVSDLVSSAPFLMNATSPYRVSGKTRALVNQVDGLVETIRNQAPGKALFGAANDRIVVLLERIRHETLILASDAEAAQDHKAKAATALGEIAVSQGFANAETRRRLNALVQSASSADSLFQLGELRRRFVAETEAFDADPLTTPSPDQTLLLPYERVFEAQTQYLLEMFSIRASVARLHTVARALSEASESQSELVTRSLNEDFVSTSETLTRLLVIVGLASVLVLLMATLSIRSVMRVSKGIVSLSSGMDALAKGQKNVGPPVYRGDETELLNLQQAFAAFRESVERVSRLRRTAEAAARTIRSTFRSMNEGIALFDASGAPITMNRRVIELVGRNGTARKMPIRQFVELIGELDPTALPEGSEPGTIAHTTAVRHRKPTGNVIEISVSRQNDGGIVLLARDVTLTDRQEQEVAKAKRLDGIMRMTHQVSHEVGNMIGIITGSLGLLEREGGFNEKQHRHVARIRKAADRGRFLASSMLSIGRQQPINSVPLDVGTVLRGMSDILEIAVGDQCQVRLTIDEGLPTILLDPELFEQSVLNLCLNASAAMPGGGNIDLDASFKNAELVLRVTDTGIGMSQEAVDKAFEPYFTTRSDDGGAGLGLAVVYGFVRQSGGEAKILSEQGIGTTVELRFPTEPGTAP